MTDYFALLDEPRRPWLDTEHLNAKFLALSATVHPDRTHNAPENERLAAHERYVELNAAYQCLRQPKERLLLLVELERGTKPVQVQQIDPAGMSSFLEVSDLCRTADALLAEQAGSRSPLLRVQFFQRSADLADRLKELEARLNAQRDTLDRELRSLNPAWESAPPIGSTERATALPCVRLEQMCRDFSYLKRWSQQLRDRILRLSFPH